MKNYSIPTSYVILFCLALSPIRVNSQTPEYPCHDAIYSLLTSVSPENVTSSSLKNSEIGIRYNSNYRL